jgi:hypothetical protein
MPEHEPEVIAASRRRKPVNSFVVPDDKYIIGEQILCCPRCNDPHLHYGPPHKTSGNRDDALRIPFWCESCGEAAKFELAITWHKGSIFIEWREPK